MAKMSAREREIAAGQHFTVRYTDAQGRLSAERVLNSYHFAGDCDAAKAAAETRVGQMIAQGYASPEVFGPWSARDHA